MASTEDLKEYVDQQLRVHRPDRYEPGAEWIDQVADSIPEEIFSLERARHLYLRQFARSRDGEATKRANKILRDWQKNGQLKLHWWDTANEPMAFEYTVTDEDGETHTKKIRVALRAATPQDFRAWADFEEEAANREYETRMRTVKAAREMADYLEDNYYQNFNEYGMDTCPPDDDK